MTRPRVLLGCVEPSSAGGTGTASRNLFNRMHGDGWDVHHVLLIDEVDAAYYQTVFGGTLGDTGGQRNVHWCAVRGQPKEPDPRLRSLVAALDPDLLIGCGFVAAERLKSAAPDRRTVFVTGTCRQAQDHVTSGRVRDVISLQRSFEQGSLVPRILNAGERRAVDCCDLVVTHSDLTLTMFERFFPGSLGKVYPTAISFAEWIADGAGPWQHLARPFNERDIDVLFVASEWDRAEKNYPMVDAITRQSGTVRAHVVGGVPHTLAAVTHHGFVHSREDLFRLMGRARTIACPSLMDAAPGVLFEGSIMGCNLVASKNCGNWEICHPNLLADPFDAATFASCITSATRQKLGDHLELFRQRGGFRELMAVLEALARPFEAERR